MIFSEPIIILALILFGSAALVPLMYFAAHGVLSLSFVYIVSIVAFAVMDAVLYSIGRRLTSDRIGKIKYFKARPHHFDRLSKAIQKYGTHFVFWSKFVYGSGTPTQVLAGAYGLSFKKVALVNLAGSVSWVTFVYILAESIKNLSALKEDVVTVQIGFLVFVVLAVLIHVFIARRVRKYFHLKNNNPSSQVENTENGDTYSNGNI